MVIISSMDAKTIKLFLLFVCGCGTAGAQSPVEARHPQYISVNFAGGTALPAKVVPDRNLTTGYTAFSLKYAVSSRADRWQDYAFGLPYWGVGVYVPYFKDYYGHPFSLFFLQGARLAQLTPAFSLNYEVNLGLSFNWTHYDYRRQPGLLAIGSAVNVHLAGNLYFKWILSRRFDLRAGICFNHFSNGATRTPNHGTNAVSAFVEAAYRFVPSAGNSGRHSPFPYPEFKRKWMHDISIQFSARTLDVDTSEQLRMNLRDKYPHERFWVVGFNYSPLFRVARCFMIGPSIELIYDQSAVATVRGREDVQTHRYEEEVKLGPFGDRFSAGLSLKAELAMPGYSVFANVGYDVYTKNERDTRVYQIYGMKIHFYRNLYAAFGVRSTNLTKSKYLFLRLGYVFGRTREDGAAR